MGKDTFLLLTDWYDWKFDLLVSLVEMLRDSAQRIKENLIKWVAERSNFKIIFISTSCWCLILIISVDVFISSHLERGEEWEEFIKIKLPGIPCSIKWIYEVFLVTWEQWWSKKVEGIWWCFTKYCNLRGSYQDCLVLSRLFIVFDKAVTEITRLNIFNNRNILIECFIFYHFLFRLISLNISGYGIWEK